MYRFAPSLFLVVVLLGCQTEDPEDNSMFPRCNERLVCQSPGTACECGHCSMGCDDDESVCPDDSVCVSRYVAPLVCPLPFDPKASPDKICVQSCETDAVCPAEQLCIQELCIDLAEQCPRAAPHRCADNRIPRLILDRDCYVYECHPEGTFPCGSHFNCDIRAEYCEIDVPGVAGATTSYACQPFAGDCGSFPDCVCLERDTGHVGTCELGDEGGLTLTIERS